jgi:hypothetical protein
MKTRTYKYNPRHLSTKQPELLMAAGSPALGSQNVAQEVLDDFPVHKQPSLRRSFRIHRSDGIIRARIRLGRERELGRSPRHVRNLFPLGPRGNENAPCRGVPNSLLCKWHSFCGHMNISPRVALLFTYRCLGRCNHTGTSEIPPAAW